MMIRHRRTDGYRIDADYPIETHLLKYSAARKAIGYSMIGLKHRFQRNIYMLTRKSTLVRRMIVVCVLLAHQYVGLLLKPIYNSPFSIYPL